MKKLILVVIGALLICAIANAQYRINKTKYDYHIYTYQPGDLYNPAVAGVTSFLIPGLGQILSGDAGRGVAFFGCYLGCWVVFSVGMSDANQNLGNAIFHNGKLNSRGETGMLFGIAGMILVDVWSIVDAVQVSKVNNMAFRDKNKTSLNLKIQPYINHTRSGMASEITTGISLKFTF